MSADPNDFLAAEESIVQRLKDALGDLSPKVHILTSADLAGVKESGQAVPAVHVIWTGFRVEESRSDGKQSLLNHTWLVVSAVRNVANTKTGAPARAEASALMARAGAALMGFKPVNATSPMLMAPAPAARYSVGHMYLPLAFSVKSHFKATP